MKKIDPATAPRSKGSRYPAPHNKPCKERSNIRLGDAAGLTQFGVNLLTLAPGAWSSQRHWHEKEDEFIYVLSGEVALVTDQGAETLRAGDSAGFKAGLRDGHHLRNETKDAATILVVGARDDADWGEYSDIDMKFLASGDYVRKNGEPIE